jgi:hypothetical protein
MTPGRLCVLAATAVVVGGAALLPAKAAAQERFSFDTVEFLAPDARSPAAEAFLNRNIRAGMPLSEAMAVLSRAGARCRPFGADAARCTHVSFQRPPSEAIQDVVWTVQVNGDPAAKVVDATVRRSVWGD